MNHKYKIAFIGPNHLHVPLIRSLLMDFDVILYPDWNIREKIPENVNIIFLDFLFVRFIHTLNRIFWLELSPPKYFLWLISSLRLTVPDIIVVMDYYNLYFWQTILYSFFSQKTQIFLYSETKMFPRGIFPRSVLRIFTFLLCLFQRRVSGIFIYSEMGMDFFNAHGIQKNLLSILPIPIDTKIYVPDEKKTFIKNGILEMLMVARFVWYKNHEILFHALSELKDEGHDNFRLSLLGSSGHMMDMLRGKVQTLWLVESVIFLEKVPAEKMPEIYKKYDLLVLPSFNEAVWMVVPEANASWIPAIVSPTVGACYYMLDGQTGFIFPSLEIWDIKKTLIKCFNKGILESFWRGARDRMEQEFSVEKIYRDFTERIRQKESFSIAE